MHRVMANQFSVNNNILAVMKVNNPKLYEAIENKAKKRGLLKLNEELSDKETDPILNQLIAAEAIKFEINQ